MILGKKIKKLNILIFEKKIKKEVYKSVKSSIIVLERQRKRVIDMNEVQIIKNQLRELNRQLGMLEATKQYKEIREKMIDVSEYHSKLYSLIGYDELSKFVEECDMIRIQAREQK